MAASKVSIWNEALDAIRESTVASIDEDSNQARKARAAYESVLAEMLEAHEWGFAGRRASLAAVTNTRDGEWAYAYAMPQGVGTPRRVIPNLSGTGGVGSPVALCGMDYTRVPGLALGGASYIIEGSTIYTWIPDAILEYGVDDVAPAEMPALFRRALALAMAERLAITLRDSRELKKELQGEASVAMQRAMADDMNRQPNREPVDDVAAVRGGAALGWPVFSAIG